MLWSVGDQIANNPKNAASSASAWSCESSGGYCTLSPADEFQVYLGMDTAWSIGKKEKTLA